MAFAAAGFTAVTALQTVVGWSSRQLDEIGFRLGAGGLRCSLALGFFASAIVRSSQGCWRGAYFLEPGCFMADCAMEPNSFIWDCIASNWLRTNSAWICMASCMSLARTILWARSKAAVRFCSV